MHANGQRARAERRWDAALVVYVCVCTAALVWPVYPALAGDAAPLWAGLPPAFVYNVAWVLATFAVLALYHRFRGGRAPRP